MLKDSRGQEALKLLFHAHQFVCLDMLSPLSMQLSCVFQAPPLSDLIHDFQAEKAGQSYENYNN